jgi:hypothetical protein
MNLRNLGPPQEWISDILAGLGCVVLCFALLYCSLILQVLSEGPPY